jgi:hypothetical protein
MHGLSRIVHLQPALASPPGEPRDAFLSAAHRSPRPVSSLRDE